MKAMRWPFGEMLLRGTILMRVSVQAFRVSQRIENPLETDIPVGLVTFV